MGMKPHGRVKLAWDNNVLRVEVIGPFNMEGVNQCFKQIQASVLAHKTEHWTRLDILDQETLGSPDVMKVIGATYKWCTAQGCLGIASVCSTFLQTEILEKTRVSTGMNLAGFKSYADAECWCLEQISEKSRKSL